MQSLRNWFSDLETFPPGKSQLGCVCSIPSDKTTWTLAEEIRIVKYILLHLKRIKKKINRGEIFNGV